MINKEFEMKNFQLENTNVCEIYSKNPKNINYCFTRPPSPPGARARAQDGRGETMLSLEINSQK